MLVAPLQEARMPFLGGLEHPYDQVFFVHHLGDEQVLLRLQDLVFEGELVNAFPELIIFVKDGL